MNIDLIQLVFGFLVGSVVIAGPLWIAIKKFISDFNAAAADDNIDAEEFAVLLADSFGILAVLRKLIKK